MATLKDIAKRCGVSVSTVSLVLNNKKECYASKAVKERIQETAKKLRYQHNAHYRSAIRGEKTQIGCIISSTKRHCWHFLNVLSRCSKEKEMSCSVIVDASKPLEDQIASLLSQNVRGIIVCSSCGPIDPDYLEYLEEQKCAIVVIGEIQSCAFPMIQPDRRGAALEMMAHLADQGHRQILSLLPPSDDPSVRPLHEGLQDAIERFDLHVEFAGGDGDMFDPQVAAETWQRAANNHPGHSAAICSDDVCAASVIQQIRQSGQQVPDDIAVVSFNGDDLGKYFEPTITSISIPFCEIAKTASEFLFNIFEKGIEEYRGQQVLLPCKVNIQASSATPARQL